MSHVYKVHGPAHVLGLGALLYAAINPSWTILVSFGIANLWLSGLGMSVGFHRYFTHRSFKTNKFFEWLMLIGGTLAGQGSVLFWVALHRHHHAKVDTLDDIHTPIKGFWHAYMKWIFILDPIQIPLRRASDLMTQPYKFMHKHYNKIMWSYWTVLIGLCFTLLLPIALGFLIAGVWSIHQEALINSVCHDSRFGQQDFSTIDNSRNVRWLNRITWGQSYHNTHHAFPTRSNFGVEKPDAGFWIIKLIQK